MEKLDLVRINSQAPFPVLFDGTSFVFEVEKDAKVLVKLTLESRVPYFKGYWLSLTTSYSVPLLKDDRIRETVICILDEFFRVNPDFILYMCEFKDDKQALRNRLFRIWFNSYEMKEKYLYKNKGVKYQDHDTFVSLIVPRSHLMTNEISVYFDALTDYFNKEKP